MSVVISQLHTSEIKTN